MHMGRARGNDVQFKIRLARSGVEAKSCLNRTHIINRGICLVGLSLTLPSIGAFAAGSRMTWSWLRWPWLQLMSPVIATWCGLWWLRVIYFWLRKPFYERREQRRNEHPVVTLQIPAGVKKLEQYDGARTLHDAQWTYIKRAVEAQGKYFANGILVAVLPPLALLLLSVQLLLTPHDKQPPLWTIGLIVSEVSCLVILVYLALTSREPTAEWIENRVRTELFRREQYLFLAGVGPYLTMKSSEAADEVLRRRGQIEGADTHALVGLVALQEHSGLAWLEALHHRGSSELSSRPDVIERMESYLYYRIGKQLLWFANEIRDLEENDRLWSRLLTGALLAAILVAAGHVFHMLVEGSNDTGYWKVVVGAAAIVLPPVGTACLSIKAMYNFRGRSGVYVHEEGLLHTQRGALEALIQEAKSVEAGIVGRDLHKIDFDFRAVALRTEQSLSVELLQWMLLMERHEHELAP